MKELILLPMGIMSNLAMVALFRLVNDNRGDAGDGIPPAEGTPPEAPPEGEAPPPEGEAPPEGALPEGTPPGEFDTFVQKKGFKSNDEIAKSYENIEAAHHRVTNNLNKTKQQLEAHGYTLDESGSVVQMPGAPQQPYQPQQPQEPVYDPYSGQQITDPLQMQLAQMPLGQREAFIFNAMSDQREKLSASAFEAEQEVMKDPGVKGFEQDLKGVMMKVPLQQRANKEAWKDALFRVKGMRYDTDRKGWGKQGIDDFINKEGAQGLPGGSGKRNVRLTAEQEEQYNFYQTNQPGMFKDKAHFLKASSNTYGAK